MKEPKVLVSAPIGGHKQYSINLWFQWLANQNYRNFDFCLCANGDARHKLIAKLKQVEIKTKFGIIKKPIALMLPKSDELSIIQKITYSRETIRRYAVEKGYNAIFWLDTDTIPASKDAIRILLSWNYESISGLYHYKDSQVPVVIDKDTHTNMNINKMVDAVANNKALEIWGSGYGCVLHRGRALDIPFDYEAFGEERTDDFGHCHALEVAGISRMFDPFILCKHFGDSDSFDKINEMIGMMK